MVAFKDLLSTLIFVFIILSVIMIPAIYIYGKYDGYAHIKNAGISKFSLGNMGYANVQCARTSFINQKIDLYCPQGRVGNIKEFGILPNGSKDRDSCYKTKSNAVCTDTISEAALAKYNSEIAEKDQT